MLAELVLSVATIVLLPAGIVLLITAGKILFGGSNKYKRVHALTKGKVVDVLKGQLSDGYSLDTNFMVSEGMAFDRELKRCVSQSTISDEAIQRIAF